jgi:sterol 24-C-methyltransferase
VDIGCGIGGPLRAISAFSGAAVTGVNNNEYQARGRAAAGRLVARKPR